MYPNIELCYIPENNIMSSISQQIRGWIKTNTKTNFPCYPRKDYARLSYSSVSHLEVILPVRDIWQCLEIFLAVTVGAVE